jgi:uncharacterized protein (TIGR03437 family)
MRTRPAGLLSLFLTAISGLHAQAQTDRMVVGAMTLSAFANYGNLPLPTFANQKFCSLLQIGPNVLAWSYVPSAAERTGNYSSFPTPLTDPLANTPFPNNVIPASRLPGVIGWRVAPTGPAPGEACLSTPDNLPQFNSVNYVSGLNAALDTISSSPSTLTFSYQLGNAIPAVQRVSVQAARTALTYAILPASTYQLNGIPQSGPPAWLTVEGGCCQTTGAPASVVVLPAQLLPGPYQTSLTVQAIDAISAPQTITVNLNVTAPPNYLILSTRSLDFTYTLNNGFPAAQLFQAVSLGSASSFTAVAKPVTPLNLKWFSVTPAAGSAPATLTVSIDPNAAAILGRGKYFGYIDVYGGNVPSGVSGAGAHRLDQTSAAPPNSPQRVGVTLTVFPNPDFTVTPQTVIFRVSSDALPPPAQTVALAPVAGLNYSFTYAGYSVQVTPFDPGDSGLVVAAPSAVSIAGELMIGVDPSSIQNLSTGEHDAVVTFVGPGNPDLTTGNVIPVAVLALPSATAIAGANPPSVSSVISAGANVPGLTPGGWIAIYGTSLAASAHSLAGSDIAGGQLPTALAGTSVAIDGRPAALSYVSPTQVNALVPDSNSRGPVTLVITTAVSPAAGTSATLSDVAPAFFPFPNSHVAAQHANYSSVGNPGDVPGATPAHPGETILLYGTGFGPTNPPTPSGGLVTTAWSLANPVTVSIGNQPAQVIYAGITEAGLCQINVVVPNLPDGEQPIVAAVKGASTQSGLKISVKN